MYGILDYLGFWFLVAVIHYWLMRAALWSLEKTGLRSIEAPTKLCDLADDEEELWAAAARRAQEAMIQDEDTPVADKYFKDWLKKVNTGVGEMDH